ncbi:hypothetical protein SSX86_029435 [Deinandra increscens subsp. villosa]|uniref:F-box domain-containing protein n=1 Tax=Deinandra increscens subsp. villosa TaxID=3103831 RepID=A0AAP0CF21_9ASTR
MAKLPPEIITQILYRLPAKSLARFRCVSKGFLSLLSQPQFIKTHQATLNRKHFITQLDSSSLFSLPFNYPKQAAILTPTELHLDLNPDRPEIDMFTFHGSCNGLILVSGHDVDGGHTLLVINPVTTELLEIPETDYDFPSIDIVFGFGYDSVTDDYKVVTISFSPPEEIPPDEVSMDVYSLKTNTWSRDVCDFPYDHTSRKSYSGVFVNGFLHWIAKKDSFGDDGLRVIVAFSLADEKLSELALPESCKKKLFLVSGEKLGVFMGGELWVMDEYGVPGSWKKIVIHGFDKDPDKDPDGEREPVVFYEDGYVVVVSGNRVSMYDIEGRLCRRINGKNFEVRGVCVESLVSPKFRFNG